MIAKLNQMQRKAAEHVHGPLLVVAGPGTGKTQLLSSRVANILQKTDAAAESILCLTFTDKAALNMRERLSQTIGPDARKVHIHTFHGLATMIIGEYPDYFWQGARFSPASDVQTDSILQDVLLDLPLGNYFATKYEGSFTKSDAAKSLIKYAKQAGLSPEKLQALAEANIAYLEANASALAEPFTQAKPLSMKLLDGLSAAVSSLPELGQNTKPIQGIDQTLKNTWETAYGQAMKDGKTAAISSWRDKFLKNKLTKDFDFQPEIHRNRQTLDLADVYQLFTQRMVAQRYYDFDDMIIRASQAIEQNPDLRADLQERFQFTLIDEFQDTNAAQLRLASLISSGDDNLMVVGDDDQSIYKFQGAELNNLINFRTDHADAQTIVLTQNYRSRQEILDLAAKLIDCAEVRLESKYPEINKDINAARQSEISKGDIKLLRTARPDEQVQKMSQDLKNYRQKHPKRSICVITRKHKHLAQVAERLLDLDIPIDYEKSANAFDQPLVATFIEALQLISALASGNKHGSDVILAQTLRRGCWQVDSHTLWRIAVDPDLKGQSWLDRLRAFESTEKIADWLDEMATSYVQDGSQYMIEKMLGLGVDDDKYSPFRSFHEKPDQIDHQYLIGLSAVKLIRDMATEFHSASDSGEGTPGELLDLCRQYLRTSGHISGHIKFDDQENPVQLLSAHKAKGLEFDAVFVAFADDATWSNSSGGGPGKPTPPANLPLRGADDDKDDMVRLMFTVVTRAISDLFFYCSTANEKGKEILPSSLLTISGLEPIDVEASPKESQESLVTSMRWPRLKLATEHDLLRSRLEDFQLSATTLTNFLDLQYYGPQKFFERNILRLPDVKSPDAAIGTAMHALLEYELGEINAGRQPTQAERKEQFAESLRGESLSTEEYQRYLEMGITRVDELFKGLGYEVPHGSRAETKMGAILPSGNTISGTLDRVDDYDEKSITVVDYKTSKPMRNVVNNDKGDKGMKAWRYRLQMTFYALLARHSPNLSSKHVSSKFVFVFADHKLDLEAEFTPSEEEISDLEVLVDKVYQRIHALDFSQPEFDPGQVKLTNITDFIDSL